MDSPGLSPNELRVILAIAGAIVLAAIYLFGRPGKPGQGRRTPLPPREAGERVEPVLGAVPEDALAAPAQGELEVELRDELARLGAAVAEVRAGGAAAGESSVAARAPAAHRVGGAGGHRVRAAEGASPRGTSLEVAGALQLVIQLRLSDYPLRLALFQAVPALGGEQRAGRIARGTEDAALRVVAGDRQLPALSPKDDAVRRFIALVDECYDRRVALYLEAHVPLDALYTQGYLAFPFQRTLSRLREMQLQRFGGG